MFLREGYFTDLPRLDTPRLLLRRAGLGDAADLYQVSRDPRVARFVMWSPHTSPGDSKDFIRAVQRSYRQDQPGPWCIVYKEENKVVGTIGFSWINHEHRNAEVGYSLGFAYWNRGIATEALRAVLREGFDHLGLHRIEAQHDVRNPASGRVMLKAGMQREGRLRERLMCKGEYVTVDLYAALARELKEREP